MNFKHNAQEIKENFVFYAQKNMFFASTYKFGVDMPAKSERTAANIKTKANKQNTLQMN